MNASNPDCVDPIRQRVIDRALREVHEWRNHLRACVKCEDQNILTYLNILTRTDRQRSNLNFDQYAVIS